MNGHWFCETCDDVVTMAAPVGRWDSLVDVFCPVCGHRSAFWVKDVPDAARKPISPRRASELFAKLRSEFNPGDVI